MDLGGCRMKLTEKAKAYLNKMFSEEKGGLQENDP